MATPDLPLHLLLPEAKMTVLSFMDFFTLIQWNSVSREFVPKPLRDMFMQLLHGKKPGKTEPTQSGALAFRKIAEDLWQLVVGPLSALQGSCLTFPGFAEVALVDIWFLGCHGCHDITPIGIHDALDCSGSSTTLIEHHLWILKGEPSVLSVLSAANPDNEELQAVTRLLQDGVWRYEIYRPNRDIELSRDVLGAIHFNVRGIVGVLLFAEEDSVLGDTVPSDDGSVVSLTSVG